MEQTRTIFNASTWKTYGYWAFWVSIAFFSIYPACNWLTSTREYTYKLYLQSELDIPLVQEFIWIYLSMYILFLTPPFFLNNNQLIILGKRLVAATILSGLLFVIIPTELGFLRVIPDGAVYNSLYNSLFTIDLPHNMAPSLHIVYSSLFLFALINAIDSLKLQLFFGNWLILICAATIFVHQHHIIDVVSGLFIASSFQRWMSGEKRHV